MKQLVQLQENIARFEAAGLSLVLVTYDTPELQQAFVSKFKISYPVLADQDTATVQALGILNDEYQPGDWAYGVPHPGIFILDPQMTIKAKIFVEAYAERVTADGVLQVAQAALDT
ncbi:MAG: redoxin domain-containing protein [Pseudomonadales bacterium]